jgi:hypothetical protein
MLRRVLGWLRPTPQRLVATLLLVQAGLWLGDRYRCFPFDVPKNWTVLLALAGVIDAGGAAFMVCGRGGVSLEFPVQSPPDIGYDPLRCPLGRLADRG